MKKAESTGLLPESVNFITHRLLGYLGSAARETTKEVRLGSWNGEMCIDIRRWRDGKLLTGINLTADELRDLRDILNELDFGR